MIRRSTIVRAAVFRPVLPILALLVSSFCLQLQPVQAQIVRSSKMNRQFHRAETAWRSGSSLLEAKARIDQVLTALPQDTEARKLRAGIYLSMNRPEDALTDALTVTRTNPDDAEAQLLVCEAAVETGDKESAIHALDRASELSLSQTQDLIRLSRCAQSLGRKSEAEAYARTALAANARSPEAILNLARVFAMDGAKDAARTILERGLREGVISRRALESDSLLHLLMEKR